VGASGSGSPSARGDIQSVRRALGLLMSFSRERPEQGVNELARAHGLHPSTVSRLLATLADAGFVRVDPASGRYRLGLTLLERAGLVLLQMDIRTMAQPIMRELAQRGEETVNLAVLDGLQAVVIEQASPARPCRFVSWPGRRVPLHATAHGKVLLAFREPGERDQIIARLVAADGALPRLTEATLVTPAALLADLARTRERGYALAVLEMDRDLAAVAAPVFDHTENVVASLSLSGPVFRYQPEHVTFLGSLIVEGAQRLSRELGWRGLAFPPLDVAVALSAQSGEGAQRSWPTQ
jgi:DNA-binding IclR family transcriptional regulator